jgi:hypothetical protein
MESESSSLHFRDSTIIVYYYIRGEYLHSTLSLTNGAEPS